MTTPVCSHAVAVSIAPMSGSDHVNSAWKTTAITTAKDGWTALTIAAREGHETVVRLLLDNGASVDKPAKHGWTALILAAEENHEAVARLLEDQGAREEQRAAGAEAMATLRAGDGAPSDCAAETVLGIIGRKNSKS